MNKMRLSIKGRNYKKKSNRNSEGEAYNKLVFLCIQTLRNKSEILLLKKFTISVQQQIWAGRRKTQQI